VQEPPERRLRPGLAALQERHHGGAPSPGFGRRILKPCHELRPGQHCAHRFALDPDAASMNDPQCFQSHSVCFFQISFDYGFHIARGHRMQIEDVGYGNADGFVEIHGLKKQKPDSASPESGLFAALRASDVLSDLLLNPVLTYDRFHLVLQVELQFF
jgi:hypothetical protein